MSGNITRKSSFRNRMIIYFNMFDSVIKVRQYAMLLGCHRTIEEHKETFLNYNILKLGLDKHK